MRARARRPAHQRRGRRGTGNQLHPCAFRYTDPGYEVWRVSANEWKFRRTADGWRVTSREAMVIDGGDASKEILKRAYAASGR